MFLSAPFAVIIGNDYLLGDKAGKEGVWDEQGI
jgi:hypothetical protein